MEGKGRNTGGRARMAGKREAPEVPDSPLFQGISKAERASILGCLSAIEKRYEKGDSVLHAGKEIRAIGLVASGSVEIVRDDFWGNRQVLGTAGPGELFGESYACISGEPLMVAVQASERTTVLFLDVGRILTTCSPACAYHSRLIHNLLYVMAKNNMMLTRKIDHMGQRTIREKVMAYLSFEAERQKKQSFQIPFNRQQLADYLAVDRSALSAELSRMQKEGMLQYEKNQFTL